MKKLWLIFAQAVTVCVAALFVVTTLKPEWLQKPSPAALQMAAPAPAAAVNETPRSQSTAPIASFADAAKRASSAVVNVYTKQKRADRSKDPRFNDPFFKFFFGDKAPRPRDDASSLGSGVIVSTAKLPMDEVITVTQDDVDTEKHSSSRLKVGTSLTRGELLHLALMSSENRAAHALGRTHPGGLPAFVALMNTKARSLGMKDTSYVEPTGLSSRNQSSARDLATLVNAAHADPILRELTTSPGYQVAVGSRTLQYNNTNRLLKNPEWDIGLQKTGYISEAGQCLVMQTKIAGRKLIMVFLDSAGKLSRLGDAERVRRWVEANPVVDRRVEATPTVKQVNG